MHNRNAFHHQTFIIHHIRTLLAYIRSVFTTRAPVVPEIAKDASIDSNLSLKERIPSGSWDSHMHVIDPKQYPLMSDALYRPKVHTIQQAMSFEASIAMEKMVLVQPSIYGYDNSCMLDALRILGPQHGRAVVSFEPRTVPTATLRSWHIMGVRGLRINFSSIGKSVCSAELREMLHLYAEECRPLSWVIQVYMPMNMIPFLEPIIPELGVRVCIDHMGHPALCEMITRNPYEIQGFDALVRLLKAGSTYVKLSAPYRLSGEPDNKDAEPVARELLRVAGRNRVVFATDWPHTRFEGLNIRPWMETVLDWCGEDDFLVERLFRENARDLWDVETQS